MTASVSRVAVVINIPTPYRSPVFDSLSSRFVLRVMYCARSEPNRNWGAPPLAHDHVFMSGLLFKSKGRKNYFHLNLSIWLCLSKFSPDIVVIGGLNPTHIVAIFWALIMRRSIAYLADGTLISESSLGSLHSLLRRLLFPLIDRFIVSSSGGVSLMQHYRVATHKVSLVGLPAPNSEHVDCSGEGRSFDLMFCGQMIPRKMPMFFLEVCSAVKKRVSNLRVLCIGSGELQCIFVEGLKELSIQYTYYESVPSWEMASHYRSAKVLVFPTETDPWGMVASEAFAQGTPVITTPEAGCAGDLVIDGVSGFVCPAVADIWAERCVSLLVDSKLFSRFSSAAVADANRYSLSNCVDQFECALLGKFK